MLPRNKVWKARGKALAKELIDLKADLMVPKLPLRKSSKVRVCKGLILNSLQVNNNLISFLKILINVTEINLSLIRQLTLMTKP